MARKVGQIVRRGHPALGTWLVRVYNGRAGQVTNDPDLAAQGQSERIGKAERPVGDLRRCNQATQRWPVLITVAIGLEQLPMEPQPGRGVAPPERYSRWQGVRRGPMRYKRNRRKCLPTAERTPSPTARDRRR